MIMSASTKRALRTAYHSLVALVVSLPVLLSGVGTAQKTGTLLVAISLVSKLINVLEDAGIIPSWLKGDTVVTAKQDDPAVDAGEPEGEVGDVPNVVLDAPVEGDAAP